MREERRRAQWSSTNTVMQVTSHASHQPAAASTVTMVLWLHSNGKATVSPTLTLHSKPLFLDPARRVPCHQKLDLLQGLGGEWRIKAPHLQVKGQRSKVKQVPCHTDTISVLIKPIPCKCHINQILQLRKSGTKGLISSRGFTQETSMHCFSTSALTWKLFSSLSFMAPSLSMSNIYAEDDM